MASKRTSKGEPPASPPPASPPSSEGEAVTGGTAPGLDMWVRVKGETEGATVIEVEPRKPRLAWQGMYRREAAVSVPTQVVEVVRPGRVVERKDELGFVPTAAPRDTTSLPPNRLIWTNDNLVALQTLLDERDPKTNGYRYRGKVDLIYIDPPFMVNSDFRADNAIEIDLDEDAGVQAKKEPSLVEILAYKDTWRQGLDSFLSMLNARLGLLHDFLSSNGSIYVHVDWHASHYVKVLCDQIFGYENFLHEVTWKRRTGYMGTHNKLGSVTDSIIAYSKGSPYFKEVTSPHEPEYIKRFKFKDERGRLYRLDNLTSPNPRPNLRYVYKGYSPPPNGWAVSIETMEQMEREGRLDFPSDKSKRIQRRSFLEEKDGSPVQNLWDDIPPINPMALEGLGYPTQKPLALLERIINISCPPGGLVLDCFAGSGTTCEAAERLGRRWIAIDNGKYAIHLARKRLIQLHGQPRPADKVQADYVECEKCANVDRKERPGRSPGPFNVSAFTVENMGVYQRAEQWQDFQTQRTKYRDEMIKVFGGEPVNHSPLLHGRKGDSWVHVGPLDGPVSVSQVWSIAREAQRTDRKAVTILSADFDTLSGSDKADLKAQLGVMVTIRIIPASAIDEVRRRLEILHKSGDDAVESMAVPAFYAPLSIVLSKQTSGLKASVTLDRCEVDIESFLASQRPISAIADTQGMTPTQRKKAEAEMKKWDERRAQLEAWLAKATSWQKFIDFWAVDWDYGHRVGADGKPIFETDWQSFRVRRGKELEQLVFKAEFTYAQPGRYRVGARVTDVFGNDGIATVEIDVK